VSAAAAWDRTTVACVGCGLVQFLTDRNACRRCRRTLVVPVAAVPAPADAKPKAAAPKPRAAISMAELLSGRILALRSARHLSQRDLAERMGVPRTYISKLENGKAGRTLGSLERVAAALEVPLAALLGSEEEFVLLGDPFLNQIHAANLNREQRDHLLQVMRGMLAP
jgi:transcriptional regulator with XRE-family HTH domain